MIELNKIRLAVFYLLDMLMGGKKKSNYNDIKNCIENNHVLEIKKKKENYLLDILQHANKTSVYYKHVTNCNTINSFPVVNKNIIKNNFSEFESNTYKEKKKWSAKTSGSTGAPFKTYKDADKVQRNIADNLYFSEQAGYTLGNKLYYFRMWDAFGKNSLLTNWLKNIIPIDVFELNNACLAKFISNLKHSKAPKSWIGYASSFEQICKYLDKTNAEPINCNLKSVIAISESLNDYTKESLKKYFGVNTVSRYSNIENGIIAQQFKNTDYFVVNTASYHLELLELNSDTPVKNGEKGRIVVTDLFNYCVPMIRYDTGDIGIMHEINGKLVLSKVYGREIDTIMSTSGDIISNNIMLLVNKYHELNQCQLIQKEKNKYLFKINVIGEFKDELKFITEFKSHLGNDAIIEVEYVDEIPLLASGKRRVMVNEMHATPHLPI